MSLRLDGRNPLAYMGVNPTQPPQLVVNKIQPTTNNTNFNLGTLWLIPNQDAPAISEELWVLISLDGNVASWVQIYPGSGGGGANSFITDSGTANEVDGDVNVLGGSNINTSGTGNTVTVNLDNSISVSGSVTAGTTLNSTGDAHIGGNLVVDGDVSFGNLTDGVLFSDGAGEITANNGTNGQVIIGGGSSPVFASLTSTGSTLTYTTGANSLNIDITAPVNVAHGGSGLTSLTAHNLLIGNGTGAATLLPPSATAGVPLVSAGAAADPAYGTAVVAGGGTGNTTFTAYSVITAGTTDTGAFQNVSGVGTAGQVLKSNGAGALPSWQSVGGSGTIVQQDFVTSSTTTSSSTHLSTNVAPTTSNTSLLASITFTPTDASNVLIFQTAVLIGCGDANPAVAICLFAGTTPLAVSSTSLVVNQITTAPFYYQQVAGTTSTTTYSLRYAGTSGTININESPTGGTYGGNVKFTFSITEVTP